MPACPNILGLLLVAGRSRRMGMFKPLLPWPAPGHGMHSTTVLRASFDVAARHGLDMIVVAGHRQRDVFAALAARSFTAVFAHPDAPMIASIREGLRVALQSNPLGVLIHLADHPAVAAETVHQVTTAAIENPNQAVVPTHDGRGGHPVFLPFSMFRAVLSPSADFGLRDFLHAHDQVRRLELPDAGIHVDLDTPDAYHRAVARS